MLLWEPKKLKAFQQVIANGIQDFLPLYRIRQDACSRDRARHRRKDNVVAPFSLVSGAAWHELQHPFTACFHNARDSLLYRRGGAGNLGSQSGNRAPGFRMLTVFRTQVPPDNFFPALCGGYSFQCCKGFFAKLGIARLDGFGEKLVFAAEMFVKAANRGPRRLHPGGDAGPIQALRPKSTSSVLQDSLVSSRLVLLFVSHISIGLYT